MKYGFSFKGIHTKEFAGLTVKTASRPIKPEMRDAMFTAPFADGAQSTAKNNPYGREFYEGRQFTVNMFLTADNSVKLNKKLAKISSWLTGSGELIFDDTPLIVWDARAAGSVDYAPERAGRKAVLSVSFEVQPFGRLLWSAGDGSEIGQDNVYLGDNLPIGALDGYNTEILVEGDRYGSITMVNYGDRYVRPIVEMRLMSVGAAAHIGAVKVTVNGDDKNSMMLGPGRNVKVIIVDCDKHTVTDDDGNNILGRGTDETWFSGNFIELPPGKNTLSLERLSNDGDGDVEVKVDFTTAYMWDVDFDETDWG